MKRVVKVEVVNRWQPMGSIGPGRMVKSRLITLECGHRIMRKLSARVPTATAKCWSCK